jgi:hypothetical protein
MYLLGLIFQAPFFLFSDQSAKERAYAVYERYDSGNDPRQSKYFQKIVTRASLKTVIAYGSRTLLVGKDRDRDVVLHADIVFANSSKKVGDRSVYLTF